MQVIIQESGEQVWLAILLKQVDPLQITLSTSQTAQSNIFTEI